MLIKSVEFAGAIGQIGQAPPESIRGLPQVAFAGRSNVGKSSLINRVLDRHRSNIARVSQQPGKTQEINFYHVRSDAGDFCLVDLPGYGYARVPDALREKWRPLIQGFFTRSPELAGVVQLVDLRHDPTPDDLRAMDFLAEMEVPVLLVFTKADKLKPMKRQEAAQRLSRGLGADPDQVITFSALSGEGKETLLEALGALVASRTDGETRGGAEGDPEHGRDAPGGHGAEAATTNPGASGSTATSPPGTGPREVGSGFAPAKETAAGEGESETGADAGRGAAPASALDPSREENTGGDEGRPRDREHRGASGGDGDGHGSAPVERAGGRPGSAVGFGPEAGSTGHWETADVPVSAAPEAARSPSDSPVGDLPVAGADGTGADRTGTTSTGVDSTGATTGADEQTERRPRLPERKPRKGDRRRNRGNRGGKGGAGLAIVLLLLGPSSGCTAAPAPGAGPSASVAEAAMPTPTPGPPGLGTLREEQVSVELADGAVLLRVTPLDEAVVRLTAPDTERRLRGLARGWTGNGTEGEASLFLVTFFSRVPGERFEPADLTLQSAGRRFRVERISPLTSGWGEQRLRPQRPESAIYVFERGIDLRRPLSVHYRGETSHRWAEILPVLEAEAARVATRAGSRP